MSHLNHPTSLNLNEFELSFHFEEWSPVRCPNKKKKNIKRPVTPFPLSPTKRLQYVRTGDCPICLTTQVLEKTCNTCEFEMCLSCETKIHDRCPQCRTNY